jgi:hypothetical protein
MQVGGRIEKHLWRKKSAGKLSSSPVLVNIVPRAMMTLQKKGAVCLDATSCK